MIQFFFSFLFRYYFIFRHKNISSQTLFSEYRCYLNSARIKIAECAMESRHWTYLYDGENPSYTTSKITIIYLFLLLSRNLNKLFYLLCFKNILFM